MANYLVNKYEGKSGISYGECSVLSVKEESDYRKEEQKFWFEDGSVLIMDNFTIKVSE